VTRIKFLICLVITLCHASIVCAEVDEKDWAWLKKAFTDANLQSEQVDKFKNYQWGSSEYRVTKETAPWASSYFPWNAGGIANRWRAEAFDSGRNDSQRKAGEKMNPPNNQIVYQGLWEHHNEKEVLNLLKKLPPQEIDKLSPVEKFDIYVGDYTFNATRTTQQKRGAFRKGFNLFKNWNGYCNGVCAAGALLPEPERPLTVTNPDGLNVVFHPADLKALAASAYFYVEKYTMFGAPTKNKLSLFGLQAHQRPANGAIIDILLRGYFGQFHKIVFMDISGSYMVNNTSIIGYKRKVISVENLTERESKYLHPEAVKVARIYVTLEYLRKIHMKTTNSATKERIAEGIFSKYTTISYRIYLDKTDQIVDGSLVAGIPDMFWTAAGKGADDTYFDEKINDYPGIRNLRWESVKTLFNLATQKN
jgi:hypothetical protein